MAFVTDKMELKPGLIIFRRGDVDHSNWYCRIKLPKADRYKTVALKTSDINAAKDKAFDQDADVRFRLKHDVAVFNRPFSQIAEEYAALQDERAARGEITKKRASLVRDVIRLHLNPYVGAIQIHLVASDRWDAYPAWRRAHGEGHIARLGSTRPLTAEEAASRKVKHQQAVAKAKATAERLARRGRKKLDADPALPAAPRNEWVMVSDATIRTEMAVFRGIMTYAISKRYVSADRQFKSRTDLKTERRDEFTLDEYRALHSKGRAWIKAANATRPSSIWTRTVAYNFILIMCNTGMRPPEAKNLRWRDIQSASDREGREIVVLWVRGKGKQRKLVAPQSVGEYLDRIRKITEELRPHIPIQPDDPVFTTYAGKPAGSLYSEPIEKLLEDAGLRYGPTGVPRGAYCFRHTYATFRLSEGVDVYFLADQMGTSVQMIEKHYGHVNTIRHADRVLQGMGGWDPVLGNEKSAEDDRSPDSGASARSSRRDKAAIDAAARQAIKVRQPTAPSKPGRPRTRPHH